jgi:hypothetical protein
VFENSAGEKLVWREFGISQRFSLRDEVKTRLLLRKECVLSDDVENKIADHLPVFYWLCGMYYCLLEGYAGVPICTTLGLFRFAKNIKKASDEVACRRTAIDDFFSKGRTMDIDGDDAEHRSKNLVKMLKPILMLLAKMADLGIVRRDVRGANVMIDEMGKLTLIDLGFCCPAGVPVPFPGCLPCASDEILEILETHDGKNDLNLIFESEYDIVSFIRSILLILNPELEQKLTAFRGHLNMAAMAGRYLSLWKEVVMRADIVGVRLTAHVKMMVALLDACPQIVLLVGYYDLNGSERNVVVESRLYMGYGGLCLVSRYLNTVIDDSKATMEEDPCLKKICSMFRVVSTGFYPEGKQEKIRCYSLQKCLDDEMSKETRLSHMKITKQILKKTTLGDTIQYMKDLGDILPHILKEYL